MEIVKVNEHYGHLYLGDCLDVLKTLPEHSIDSLVTDPPSAVGLMNLEWDSFGGQRDRFIDYLTPIFSECSRVLKPGAHILVWALPKTSHWTAFAIENAGFEIRECISHIFGNGFPKNMDISVALDKQAGAKREIIGLRHDAGKLNKSVQQAPGGWTTCQRIPEVTKPSTPEAIKFDGFGTALKPSHEVWILARKNLDCKTIAENVKKWGTGALNINATRVPWDKKSLQNDTKRRAKPRKDITNGSFHAANGKASDYIGNLQSPPGRFPSNTIFSHAPDCEKVCSDDCPVKMLESASKFFINLDADPFIYQAKASVKEKNQGLVETTNNHPTVKSVTLMLYLCKLITPPSGIVLDCFAGTFTTGLAALSNQFNFIGMEKDESYFKIGLERMRSAA